MAEPGRLSVKGWTDFQHYSGRRPPWIKLHRTILDDPDFQCLPLASRALAPMLWLLASESEDGTVSNDPKRLAFRLRCSVEELTAGLIPLIMEGFIVGEVLHASKPLAPRKQVARIDKETTTSETTTSETERETDSGERTPVIPADPTPQQTALTNFTATDALTATSNGHGKVGHVFDAWRNVMGHAQAKLTPKRKRAIEARLKDSTVEEIEQAIEGCRSSPFHQGDNDQRTVYDDIALICRDREHVEKFMRISTDPAAPRTGKLMQAIQGSSKLFLEHMQAQRPYDPAEFFKTHGPDGRPK